MLLAPHLLDLTFFKQPTVQEAVDCVKEELKLEKKHHIFVQSAVQLVVDAKSKVQLYKFCSIYKLL